jgi:hypothetical protein
MSIRHLSRSKKKSVGHSGVRSIYCDVCGEPIELEKGRVEWVFPKDSASEPPPIGLHIVHIPSPEDPTFGCMYDKQRARREGYNLLWYPLADLLGRDGLMRLLKLHEEGLLSDRDTVHLVRRLHSGRR